MTIEEKELLEEIKVGNNILGIAEQVFESNDTMETKIKSGLKAINLGTNATINIIETKEIYNKTRSKKRALAKFTSNTFTNIVTVIMVGSSVSVGQPELVLMVFVVNDIIQQRSEHFLNTLFDCIESKYIDVYRTINGFESNIINGAINRKIYGF